MENDEKTPLLKSGNNISETNHLKTVPFLRCVIFCGIITFFTFVVIISSSPIISQYVHAKLLEQYHVNATEDGSSSCSANSSSADDDPLIRAQKGTSNFLLLLAVTSNIPAVIVNVLLGSGSDYLGRKMLFFIPVVFLLVRNLMCVLLMYFQMDIQYFYIAYTIEGFGGSGCALIAAIFSYAADITSRGRGRIVATTAVEVLLALSATTAVLLAGFLIPLIGYLYLSVMMTVICVLALILIIFLPETREKGSKNPWHPFTHVKNVFGFYLAKREGDRRVLYILLLFIFQFQVMTVLGRNPIETLYGLAEPFCWDSVQIGYFGALRMSLASFGTIAAIKLLQHHIRDETIALIGAIDSVIACILEGLATSGWMLYLVPVVGVVSATTVPIIRGSMSRMTSPHEQGAIFAGIAFVETVTNLVCQVLYNSVYSATVAIYSGTVFFLMASFSAVAAVLIIIWIVISPKYRNVYTIHVTKEEEVSVTKETLFTSSQVII